MSKEWFVSAGVVLSAGFGAPLLHELRELLQDLWYRNKHQKELAQLEIELKALELQKKTETWFARKKTLTFPSIRLTEPFSTSKSALIVIVITSKGPSEGPVKKG